MAGEGWTPRAAYTVGLLTLVSALNYFDRAVLSLVLPLVKRDLQVSDTALGLASGLAFVLFYTILGVPVARLADRWNRRNIIVIGLGFWSLMTCLTGWSATIWQLALCRFLMGAGEASGMAPSNALVADLVGRARRPLASAFLAAGATSSGLLFSPLAGWIAQHHGWRATFLFAGAPGLVVALLLALTVQEPPRAARAAEAEPFRPAIAFLLGSRTYRRMLLGGSLMGVAIYGAGAWNPTFLVRVHHLSLVEIGSLVGPISGLSGISGVLLGGFLADRLGRIDERWRLRVPALACLLAGPATLLLLLAPGPTLALVGLGLANLFISAQLGPMYAAAMTVARPRMRATSIALMLLCVGLVGQTLGPVTIGWLNDRLAGWFGEGAIRYSLMVTVLCAMAGGGVLLAAARSSPGDAARAGEG